MVETRFDVRGRTKTTTIPLSPTAEEHEYEIKLNGKMKTKIESGV